LAELGGNVRKTGKVSKMKTTVKKETGKDKGKKDAKKAVYDSKRISDSKTADHGGGKRGNKRKSKLKSTPNDEVGNNSDSSSDASDDNTDPIQELSKEELEKVIMEKLPEHRGQVYVDVGPSSRGVCASGTRCQFPKQILSNSCRCCKRHVHYLCCPENENRNELLCYECWEAERVAGPTNAKPTNDVARPSTHDNTQLDVTLTDKPEIESVAADLAGKTKTSEKSERNDRQPEDKESTPQKAQVTEINVPFGASLDPANKNITDTENEMRQAKENTSEARKANENQQPAKESSPIESHAKAKVTEKEQNANKDQPAPKANENQQAAQEIHPNESLAEAKVAENEQKANKEQPVKESTSTEALVNKESSADAKQPAKDHSEPKAMVSELPMPDEEFYAKAKEPVAAVTQCETNDPTNNTVATKRTKGTYPPTKGKKKKKSERKLVV
jgi:hypothetical protein